MASKVIRRSKSDPNALFRRKYVSYDGKLFIKKGHEDDDEEELLGGTEDHRRFRKRKPAEGMYLSRTVTDVINVNNVSLIGYIIGSHELIPYQETVKVFS